MIREFIVSTKDVGKRTDVFVAEKFPEYARSSLKGLFDKNLVLVNGHTEQPGDKLKRGDAVRVDSTPLTKLPEHIELPIIYEDEDVIVINKPEGLLSHGKGALNTEPTVASYLARKINDKKLTGNRAGIVHRLDRATSGVIIGAKNSMALSYLQKQFSLRKTKKTYLAVVEGIPSPDEAIIDAPIIRSPQKPQTFKAALGGKPAQTKYKLLKSYKKNGRNYAMLLLQPTTGRTHQLRVHLAYIGHPIVGDRVYGHVGEHMLLHAKSLEITLPNKERKIFEANTPAYFEEYLK